MTDASQNRIGWIVGLLLVALSGISASCGEPPVVDEYAFKCETDSDCAEGHFCTDACDNKPGRCTEKLTGEYPCTEGETVLVEHTANYGYCAKACDNDADCQGFRSVCGQNSHCIRSCVSAN